MPATTLPGALAGLSAAEAERLLLVEGPNELPTARPRNLLQQAWDVIREPMLLLLLGAGSINFLLAEPLDGVILMSFVVVVIGISLYQEHKTENALAALRDLSSPRALVVRDGQQLRIPGREVVRGDVVLLVEGDRVPADAVLLDSLNFSLDESALTGESVPVRKTAVAPEAGEQGMGRPGGEATPWVFSGTLAVKGRAIARVRETGLGTELGRIGTALRSIEPERTPLQREIDRMVRVIAVVGLGAAAAVVLLHSLTRGNWLEGLLAGIATAMAMLPEEFPVVLTVFLALGALRMSRRHVLTRRSAVIETLGSATVLCVDKTGTLTLNQMTVRELRVEGQAHRLGEGPLPEEFHALAEYAVLASPVDPFDPMDKAFKTLGEQCLAHTEHLHADWELVREYPLSEKLLALSHVWRSPDARDFVVAAKGAPEAIADLCHFGPQQLSELTVQVEAATAQGQRVLAVARARFRSDRGLPGEQHDFEFEFLGLAGLSDPVRPGVAEAVAECARAGVRTVMITGDYPGTAMAIAREIGLAHDAGYITGPELEAMTDQELARRARTVHVFARMVPDQKLRLVRALKANGEVVGMTGDGVNDAPALRAADIGLAMGARGTEAMSYILAVHGPIFGMSLVPVLVPEWPLVLLPVQIAFLELIIDPACSVVFESEEVDPKLMDLPPRGLGEPVFGRRALALAALQGGSSFLAVLGVYLGCVQAGRPADEVRSVTFATLVIGNLALILVNRSWRLSIWRSFRERTNRPLKWILGGASALLVLLLSVPWLGQAFHLAPIHPADGLVALGAGFLGVAWFEVYKAWRG